MNLFFLDFETTGLSPYTNEIIEIAIQSLGLNDIVPFDPKIKFEHLLFDTGEWETISCPSWSNPDPLDFVVNGKKFIIYYAQLSASQAQPCPIRKLEERLSLLYTILVS